MIRDKYACGWRRNNGKNWRNGARQSARARILLAPVGPLPKCGAGTVYGLSSALPDGALWDRRQVNRHRKLDDRSETSSRSGPAPEGHDHWTLRLLAGVELGLSMSHEGVRKVSKKRSQRTGWCIPKVSAEFVANMEEPVRRTGSVRWSARDLHPVAGGDPALSAAPAWTSPAAGLRIPAGRHPQSVPGLRRNHADFRCAGWWMKPIRRSRWCGWSWTISTPTARRRCVPSGRWADCETAGVPLHPEARELVEYGGNRGVLAVPSGSPTCAREGSPGTGATPPEYQVAVQNPGRPIQTSPPLSFRKVD